MNNNGLPLKPLSIGDLFWNSDNISYEIPIYQRNYAWEKEEIATLIQDTYDSFIKCKESRYYIGTLVSHHKGDQVYEIVDGQQRLTTIRLLLEAFAQHLNNDENGVAIKKPINKLTYRARKRSDETIKSIPYFDIEDPDLGIKNGYRYSFEAISEIVDKEKLINFYEFFKDNVVIIHYVVQKDIDLNHYFEVMNSRGEQLEKHEIVKAKLMNRLQDHSQRTVFNAIWDACSDMGVYVQQKIYALYKDKVLAIFGNNACHFLPKNYEMLVEFFGFESEENYANGVEIINMLSGVGADYDEDDPNQYDTFMPIIDFPNFLLIVLKITLMENEDFNPEDFNLDDKELIKEFDSAKVDAKGFGYNLLKAKYLLDNYIVHHIKEDDNANENPWKLQRWQKNKEKYNPNNLADGNLQFKLTHLLSMFEVSFTARQRKNYLFYCLLYLMKTNCQLDIDTNEYATFVEDLANRYFNDVYLVSEKLNSINTPLPHSFDGTIFDGNRFKTSNICARERAVFIEIYGDVGRRSRGVPLFVFNYIDYMIWKLYVDTMRGEKMKSTDSERVLFFKKLGCSDFGLDEFNDFYFSRTRRSLEHFYPQHLADGKDGHLTLDEINCIGNYAMIGSAANSSGSDWTPKTKLDHYQDSSGKINQISVASLKFKFMMQKCQDKGEWGVNEIKEHQECILNLLGLVR